MISNETTDTLKILQKEYLEKGLELINQLLKAAMEEDLTLRMMLSAGVVDKHNLKSNYLDLNKDSCGGYKYLADPLSRTVLVVEVSLGGVPTSLSLYAEDVIPMGCFLIDHSPYHQKAIQEIKEPEPVKKEGNISYVNFNKNIH